MEKLFRLFRRFHLATEDQVITEKFTINYWIKLLDLDNIANLFDGCLMSGAKDAKHDNFMLREVFNKKLSLKLSSIDNDEAMAEEITANCDGKHISGIKLVFLTIPELLDLEVPESWKKKYRNLEEIDIMVLLFRF
ncbi:MAG: hypothetical protein HWD59_02230 [Coxiellaceae bacterium]|nr:MAG: hypothetical protein HWD59_02230 [Coxiellaceae bacterium]